VVVIRIPADGPYDCAHQYYVSVSGLYWPFFRVQASSACKASQPWKITVFDPNVAAGVTPAPPVGVQGDPCAEFGSLSNPGILTIAPHGSVAPGSVVTLTGHGYRSGESVAFTLGATPIGSAIADTDGDVALAAQVPAGTPTGKSAFSAVGAGSGFTSTVTVNVRR